jgi:uncharacterized protein DUF4157
MTRSATATTSQAEPRRQVVNTAASTSTGPVPYSQESALLFLQRAVGNRAVGNSLTAVHSVLNSDSGQPIDPVSRTVVESRFGQDFSKVRLHTGTNANNSTRMLGALAYTFGNHIVLGAGQEKNQRILAHELTHVAQTGSQTTWSGGIGSSHDPLETEADRAAESVVSSAPVRVAGGQPAALRMTPDPKLGPVLEKIREIRGNEPAEVKVQRIFAAIGSIDLTDPDNLKPISATVENSFTGADRQAVLSLFINRIQELPAEPGGPTRQQKEQMERTMSLMQVGRRGPYGQVGPGVLLPVVSQPARHLLPVVEAIQESEALRTVTGGLLGEFNEDPTVGMIAVDLGVSLVPILDQVSDARDIVAHLYFMIGKRQYDRFMRWVGLVFTLIGLVPEIGSAIKSASKFAIKGAREVLGHLDDLLRAVRRFLPKLPDLGHFRKLIADSWSAVISKSQATWNRALDAVGALAERIPAALAARKQQFIETVARIRQLSPSKLKEAFAWARKKLDDLFEAIAERARKKAPAQAPDAAKATTGERILEEIFRRGGKINRIRSVSLKRLRNVLGRAGVSPSPYKLQKATKADIEALIKAGTDPEHVFGWVVRDGAGKVLSDNKGRPIITFTKKGLSSLEEAVKTFGHEVKHLEDFAMGRLTSSEALAELAGEKLWLLVSESLKKR